jgi:transcriptional regulator GlxA family with amidase domain
MSSIVGCVFVMAPAPKGPALTFGQVQKVQNFIEAHLGDPIVCQELADCVQLSRFHFARAFRRSTGMSPHCYIIQRRLEYAQHLMLSTNASLLMIALECGFSDHPHLSRAFVKALGATPRSWRQAHRQDQLMKTSTGNADTFPVGRQGLE